MLVEPRRGFRCDQSPACDVPGGGRPFESRDFRSLGLGNVARRVEVEEVARRSVRLIPHDRAASASPGAPRLSEVVVEEIRDGQPVVGRQPRARLAGVRPEQCRQVSAQVIAATPLELVEQQERSIRLPVGIIHFVRVVEERAQSIESAAGEGGVESRRDTCGGVA